MGRILRALPPLIVIVGIVFFSFSSEANAKAENSSVLNVFLVQNSGWMEPFYTDPDSKLKPFVGEVIRRVTPKNGEAVLAAFNQSVGENRSPSLVYRGRDRNAIVESLERIRPAMKPGGRVFADTDFKEAVIGSITQYSPGRPCILWIFTNNKNSPDNSLETAERNKEFYRWLQEEKNIKRILSYPFSMPVKGKRYEANGLMVYAIAYGGAADDVLEALAAAKLPFGKQPGRLKPLDAEAVTFVPTGADQNDHFSATLAQDGKTLVLRFDSSSRPEVAVIQGRFTNDFYPYDIHSADLSLQVKFQGENRGIQASIEPKRLRSVSSGEKTETITVRIGIPPLPSIWTNPEIIFKTGYRASAVMTFTLSDQELRLSSGFEKRMNEVFPGDPLPEIFMPGQGSRRSATEMPLLIEVAYPTWPLIVLVAAALLFLVGGFFLLAVMTRARKYTVSVEGTQKVYRLKPFGECVIYNENGERIGTLKRGIGKPSVRLEEGRSDRITIQ